MQRPKAKETHTWTQKSRGTMQLLCYGLQHNKTQATRRSLSRSNTSTQPTTWTQLGINLQPAGIRKPSTSTTPNSFLPGSQDSIYPRPLRTIVNDKCTSKYAHNILAGTADIESLPVNAYTKDLLHNLKTEVQLNENTHHPLDTEALIQGFKTWPKQTSTSPSGQHLGIYKLLAKHFPPPKDKNDPVTPPEPSNPLTCSNDVLKLIIMMMDLAVLHTHTYKRWKVIWMLLLEKDPSNPQIDWLRMIHLYEADYNLLLKWVLIQRFYPPKQDKAQNQWQPRWQSTRQKHNWFSHH